ncbi:MAG: NAD(P)H-binding protein [Chloroflexi bacterium]|nr:NAD(P)H-binding protein [Chloroflexota bacterium]
MRVTVVGGTGRIGRLAVRRAIAAGHDLTTLAGHASPEPGVRSVIGDVRDPEVMLRALEGADAVIAAIGPRANTAEEAAIVEHGMRNLVEIATALGVRRVIVLSGAAVDVSGDRKPLLDRLASWFVRRAARHVVGAKQREYKVLSASALDWTALRPPLVTNGAARGYRLVLELRPGARVTREDVAQALVDQLVDPTYVRMAPFVLPGLG